MVDTGSNTLQFIMNLVALGETYKNIAKRFNRTEQDIELIVLNSVCNQIDSGNGIQEYYCNEYNISLTQLANFRKQFRSN